MTTKDHCSADEYIEGDDDLAFCFETDNQNWDEDFFSNVFSPNDAASSAANQEESGDEDADDQPELEPKIKTLREAIGSLESVQHFLRYNSHPYDLSPVINALAELNAKRLFQTPITDFFQ